MKNNSKQHIFFVDDQPNIGKAVKDSLEQAGLKVSCFTSAADCLAKLHFQKCDLLITDVKMPGMDGLELLAEVKRSMPSLPVLVITGYGDVPMAVKALKTGAIDFIEKPLDRQSLLSAVRSALKPTAQSDSLSDKGLTGMEVKVLRLILDGKSCKDIADVLHRSVRTIETHRSHIMKKFGVDNAVNLVKKAFAAGLVDMPRNP